MVHMFDRLYLFRPRTCVPLNAFSRPICEMCVAHQWVTVMIDAHSWRLDTKDHDTAEMSSSLYHFAQKLFKE
jgi:hypothetical protein